MRNFLLALACAVIAFPSFAVAKPVVKIGVSAPLTGDNAHLGESMRDAMTLAKENLSADTKFDYEIIFEDDALEAKKAALAANKLVSVDKVDALVSFSSGTGGVVSPIAEQNKKIHFGIASAQSVADGDYNFLHNTPPVEECRVMAAELQKRGYKKLAMILLNHPFPLEERDRLKEKLAGSGVDVVAEEIVNPGEKDFRTIISKVKETKPDIYLVIFFSPELEILVKQIKEAGITEPITSIEGFGLSNEISLYEGMWFVDGAAGEAEFYEKYKARFKKDAQVFSPNAYDIFNLIVYGYEHAAAPAGVKPSQPNVIKALHEVKDYNGMLGNLSMDEKGVVFSPASVKIIKDGKPVVVTE
ncbi:MAG: ABC transporter substrate-binding protein [Alphaproteobacteria bacterium]|nr:ABC transporter substrate-binding protein [Alphaproteobacteria bacterium]